MFEFQQPAADFWRTAPRHFWYLHQVTDQKKKSQHAPLTGGDVRRLKRMMEMHSV